MATQTGSASEEARIRATIDDWSNALSAKQADRVMAHYADAPVLFTLAPPLVAKDDPGGLEAWFATWRGPIGNDIRELAVNVGGDVAFCHSLNRMSGTKTDGEVVDLWFRQTLGLRKLGGTWKIVHEHTSVPFYMDGSLRAAVDLKP